VTNFNENGRSKLQHSRFLLFGCESTRNFTKATENYLYNIVNIGGTGMVSQTLENTVGSLSYSIMLIITL